VTVSVAAVEVLVTVTVEFLSETAVTVDVRVVVDVLVTVVGERDKGTRIRVADTRTPTTNIAAAM